MIDCSYVGPGAKLDMSVHTIGTKKAVRITIFSENELEQTKDSDWTDAKTEISVVSTEFLVKPCWKVLSNFARSKIDNRISSNMEHLFSTNKMQMI